MKNATLVLEGKIIKKKEKFYLNVESAWKNKYSKLFEIRSANSLELDKFEVEAVYVDLNNVDKIIVASTWKNEKNLYVIQGCSKQYRILSKKASKEELKEFESTRSFIIETLGKPERL